MSNNRCTLILSSAAILYASSTGVFAAQKDDEQPVLEVLEVVGKGTNAVIDSIELERYQSDDLADVFRHIPSVSVGGSLGIAQKIYIRGLEDTLLNITVDGAPQTGTLFHHIGRVSIEPELLEQVDVQAGAGEATSGAGAIGGSIRFKTKSAKDLLADGKQFGGLIKGGYFSNNGYKGSAAIYGKLSESWGLLGSYVYIDRDNFKDGSGKETAGTAAEQSLGFIKLNGDIADHSLVISYEQRIEEGELGQRPNWPVKQGQRLFEIEGQRDTLVFNHNYNNDQWLDISTTLYQTKSQFKQNRDDRWGLYGGEVKTQGFDIRNLQQLGKHSLEYGVEYRKDIVKSGFLTDVSVWGSFTWDPNIGHFQEEGEVRAIYIQDHWQLLDELLLSFGARYDEYEMQQVTYQDKTESDGFSPNAGLEYKISNAWTFNLSYAEALRGKEVGDAFTLEKRPGRISLQPGLKAETVENRETSIVYDDGSLSFSLALYDMTINNVILDKPGSGPAPQNSTYYENIGKVESNGVELSLAYQWDSLRIAGSYSQSKAELNGHMLEGYEHGALGNSSGDTFNFLLDYELNPSLTMGWNLTYVKDLNNIEVLHRSVELGWINSTQTVDKPGYTVHDIYIQWLPFETDVLKINFAVQNLLDENYRDHASIADYTHINNWGEVAGLKEAGRDVRLSISYQF